ncbi:YjjG family noncanonical pyrimidine nucleotidase [uncultured Maribacter sp.]|uniref:YjjG family noncanonical pyrimidine nucleotidase n=1 Tax=uncultured Maribacter sp. TaxID=431308 RepID=UPI002610EEAF|nr:YjjG family noncanonical pyrimidine nucleotidase [uncultured Maribacter sp.]
MFREKVTDVFFDLDHTLWDFEKNSALTFSKILAKNDISVDLDTFLKVYVPANLNFWKLYREDKITKENLRYQRLKTVFESLNYPVSDKIIGVLSEEYIEYLSTYNHLFPYTVEILEYLKPNYNLHIITNGFQEVQRKKLKNANIFDFFKVVIDSEQAGVKKPNPIIFNKALNEANVRPEQSLMIGDSLEADILGAKAVGFNVLHFNAHGEDLHDHCTMIKDLSEIKSYL